MLEQMLLLVDTNDHFLGYEKRSVCHDGKGRHHRAFVVCLFNDGNEILLQKRKHTLWDGYWDVTAISHPLHLPTHDETYEEAGSRALDKEMGIKNIVLKRIGAFNYFAQYGSQCENEYCSVLIGTYSGKVKVNPEDVYEYTWMSTREFIKDCKRSPKLYAPWTILTAEMLSKDLS